MINCSNGGELGSAGVPGRPPASPSGSVEACGATYASTGGGRTLMRRSTGTTWSGAGSTPARSMTSIDVGAPALVPGTATEFPGSAPAMNRTCAASTDTATVLRAVMRRVNHSRGGLSRDVAATTRLREACARWNELFMRGLSACNPYPTQQTVTH